MYCYVVCHLYRIKEGKIVFSLLYQLHSQIIAESGNLWVHLQALHEEVCCNQRGALAHSCLPRGDLSAAASCALLAVRFLRHVWLVSAARSSSAIHPCSGVSYPCQYCLSFLPAFSMHTQRDACLWAPVRLTSPWHSRQTAASLRGCLVGCLLELRGIDYHSPPGSIQRARTRSSFVLI